MQPSCLANGGDAGARLRAVDWANNPLGPVEQWPLSLRSATRMVLGRPARECWSEIWDQLTLTFDTVSTERSFHVENARYTPDRDGDLMPGLFPPEQAMVLKTLMDRALAGEPYKIVEKFGDSDRVITGFAENALLSNGQLEPGMAVMTKPFSVDALGMRIKEMISGGR